MILFCYYYALKRLDKYCPRTYRSKRDNACHAMINVINPIDIEIIKLHFFFLIAQFEESGRTTGFKKRATLSD